MKICRNCGTTLEDNEDYCVICEQYQNAEARSYAELEYKKEEQQKKEDKRKVKIVRRIVIISAIVLIVTLISVISKEAKKGKPSEVLTQYLDAVSAKDTSAMAKCAAVKQEDLIVAKMAYEVMFLAYEDIDLTCEVIEIESLSKSEESEFWNTQTMDSKLTPSNREVGAMSRATVVVFAKGGKIDIANRYYVYIGVYDSQWKIIGSREIEE